MKTYLRIIFITAIAITTVLGQEFAWAQNSLKKNSVPARLAADYIHAVINAGRRVYSQYIVDRLGKKISLQSSENWEEENSLMLPAQFLSISSQLSNKRGIGMRYRIASLWPINPNNSPKSENEKTGLRAVAKGLEESFTWVVRRRGVWYFQAIYPDIAVAESCVSCHNSHPNSPRNDFKVGDVMGGIIINFPLGSQFQKDPDSNIILAPEVVADYVHTVLESDRIVYATHVVNRLASKNILHATENWEEENSLMLPAQFLLNSAKIIARSKLDLNFKLLSLWPINDQNGPANEFDRRGLEMVNIHPIRPFIGFTNIGRKIYFQAIYPDIAVTQGCVTCHNGHPNSPKHDFKLDDVMGGIRVTFFIPQNVTQ